MIFVSDRAKNLKKLERFRQPRHDNDDIDSLVDFSNNKVHDMDPNINTWIIDQ